MNILLTVFYAGDLYEAVIKDNVIFRITRYSGASRQPRDVCFDSLPRPVKQALVDKYNQRNEQNESEE